MSKKRNKKWESEYETRRKMLWQKRHDLMKNIVFEYYSDGKIKCVCCGETDERFLTVDHIKGRKRWNHDKKMDGLRLWTWIVKNDFPPDFQILCMNCNWAKGKFGICPHKENIPRIKLLDDELHLLKDK